MTRVIWGILFLAAVALSGFLLYLTLTRDDVPPRGFLLAGGILVMGILPLSKAITGAVPKPDADEDR